MDDPKTLHLVRRDMIISLFVTHTAATHTAADSNKDIFGRTFGVMLSAENLSIKSRRSKFSSIFTIAKT